MKTSFNGLHLWKIGLRFTSNNLWIVTNLNSVVDAVKKAKKFLRTPEGSAIKFNAQIESVTYEGTLDA